MMNRISLAYLFSMPLSSVAFSILYPMHPLYPKQADGDYQNEFLEMKEQEGVTCSLFDFDAFIDGSKVKPRPPFERDENVLYRGWMMTPTQYSRLVQSMERWDVPPVTSVEQYTRCHHLPGWYEACSDLTAETHFVYPEKGEDTVKIATNLGWDSFFVKDFVKSNTASKGSIAQSPAEILEIIEQLEEYRGQLEGGIALRKVEHYVPDSERRFFVVNDKCYSYDQEVPSIVETVAARIQAPFISVDVARLQDGGDWRVIELGDGQVSDKKEWPLDRFVEVLSAVKQSSAFIS